jgi:peptidoglycan hydrolase-like protein with peptidoglycan-binding domain
MSRTLPITKLVMPSTLNGQQNGRLPDSLLTTIGVGNARMERTAARSFIAMFAEARRAIGVTVKHVGDYRPFETQLNLFLSRYQQATLAQYTVTPAAHRKIWKEAPFNGYQSTYWIKKKNANGSYPATAATPGNSNHGWGLALDIAEEYDSDAGPDPIRAVFVGWLCEEAHRYGVSAELQSEPWHWRYVAGDRIPVATLDFERNNGVVPPPPVPTPGPASVLAYPGIPIVRGSTFIDAVKMVQTKVGATPDGDFGPTTERRVKDWQKSHALLPDGVVGVVTWKKMFG